MQEEDLILQPFASELIDLVQGFIEANPKIVVVARQHPRMIECITSFFKERQWNVELVEYEFNTAIMLEKPFLQIASEVFSNSPMQRNQSRHQGLSINIMQASSQTYQNQLVWQNCERRSQAEPIIKEEDIQGYIIQGSKAKAQEKPIQPQVRTRSASKRQPASAHPYAQAEIRDQCKREEILQYGPQPRHQLRAQDFVNFKNINAQLNEQVVIRKRRKMVRQKRKEVQKKKTRRQRERQEGESCREISLKGRKPEFPLMETKLIEQIKEACANKQRITQQSIRDRAKVLVKGFPQYDSSGFTASKGWIEKFLHRHPRILKLLNNYNRRRFINGEEGPEEIFEEDEDQVQEQ